jgi:hypothetical protein
MPNVDCDYCHALETEHGQLVSLGNAAKRFKDALAGRILSEDEFRVGQWD